MKSRSTLDPSRRIALKAAGVSIALPLLESVHTAEAVAAKNRDAASKRMVFVSTGLGMNPSTFFPDEYGAQFASSPVLPAMMKHRGEFTLFSHMDHPNVFTKHAGIKSLLNGVLNKNARPGQNISIDQVAANHLGYTSRFPSLHISLGGAESASYSSSGILLRQETSPEALFKKLFVADSAAARKQRALKLEEQGSVLDLVRTRASRLERDISRSDRAKLDEYLTAIREAEERLQGMRRWQDIDKPKVTKEQYDPAARGHGSLDYGFLGPVMFDLLALALQSDSTRVITANFSMHNRVIEIDGVTKGYHTLSHHGNRPSHLRELQIIETFYMQQLSRFIEKLKGINSNSGSLLDDTMVFFGSGISDASRHSNRNLPIILAGGGLKHQGHYDAVQRHNGKQTPLNNLFTTMLQHFGIEIESFNGATGNLNHVLA
ncbi:hypothetical protein SV7mr_50750 [Stieleria bergensis]|uniref:DUF1552 domain-containing protein n=1 Tax=Stieleria bergensis TaxID=2528025 RepID=A0A517T2B3_9BACT|nr:hypothetical protein SV7mr_50750 [Planctomycetes bacterium SV_7m_r]